jgi:hypothetical protein
MEADAFSFFFLLRAEARWFDLCSLDLKDGWMDGIVGEETVYLLVLYSRVQLSSVYLDIVKKD